MDGPTYRILGPVLIPIPQPLTRSIVHRGMIYTYLILSLVLYLARFVGVWGSSVFA